MFVVRLLRGENAAMKPSPILVLTTCLTLGACSAEKAVSDGTLLPIEHIASVVLSPLDSASYQVILDQNTWAAIWARMVADHAPPAPPVPTIDFGSRVVILAVAGEIPTQLHAFRVDEVRLQSGILQVTVVQDWPASQCGSLPVVTHPVDIVSVARVATEATFLTKRISSC